jgi:hypothetical protein
MMRSLAMCLELIACKLNLCPETGSSPSIPREHSTDSKKIQRLTLSSQQGRH